MNGIDYKVIPIRDSAVLTNSYVASDYEISAANNYNQIVFEIQFTLGSLTSGEIVVEISQDGITWVNETFSEIVGAEDTLSLGYHTMLASGNYHIAVPIQTKMARVLVKGTGTVTGSDMVIRAIVGVA